jgi:hypothetical protein
MSTETLSFMNPVREVVILNWPFGNHRVKAWFQIESNKRGERVARRTENKSRTGWNKPKRTTYETRMAIVTGNDGKTYFLGWSSEWQTITVWAANCQHTIERVRPDDERFPEMMAMIDEVAL